MLALGVARQLLGEAGLAHAGLAEQQEQGAAGVADGVLDAVAEQAQLGLAPDEAGPVALGPVAGRRDRRVGPPRGHELLPALDVDRLEGVVAHDAARGREGGRAHEDVARLGGALQPVGGVHHVAHRGVVAAGAERADEHLTGVDPDAHPDVDPELGRGERQRLLHPQGGTHGALGVVLVRGRRTEEGDDGVADDLVDPPTEGVDVGHEPLEAVVDQVLHLLGVTGLGQRGVADQVGEEDGDDPTLVPPQSQVLSALGQNRAPAGTSAWQLGQVTVIRIYRGGPTDPPFAVPGSGPGRIRDNPHFGWAAPQVRSHG